MTSRLALPRWRGKGPDRSGCHYHNTARSHTVRSKLDCGAGSCTVEKGTVVQHTLHVTCHDQIFDTEVRGEGRCQGLGLSYVGHGRSIKEVQHGSETEFLIFDHKIDTGGSYAVGANTVSEQVTVKVSSRELDKKGQWETVAAFDLTITVEI